MQEERLQYLFNRYLEDNCPAEEKKELSLLALHSENEAVVKNLLEEFWSATSDDLHMRDDRADEMIDGIFRPRHSGLPAQEVKVRHIRWLRVAVAASVILLLGSGLLFWFNNNNKPAIHSPAGSMVTRDVRAPQTNRAMIILANGQRLYLDSAGNGMLATQNNVRLTKTGDGKISYLDVNPKTTIDPSKVIYNTLSNPRGSKVIDMVLSDGSHVWLNAASSITFPVSFVGCKREVSVAGEAYFEVTHNASKPFIVSKGDVDVMVLGTHFNVNAYDDEDNIKVTLLEGSVKVLQRTMHNSKLLKPGEQAVLSGKSPLNIQGDIDLTEVMAWKNGEFVFNKTDIQAAMRELARWYDMDIEYKGSVNGFFKGSVRRKENASQVLKMLEMTGEVHLEIEGRKIIVGP